MNESFRLAFKRSGRDLKISRFTMRDSKHWPRGITLDGEWSCWPLGIALDLVPRNSVTRNQLSRVRQRQGWNPDEFDLQVISNGSYLEFSGVSQDALPEGGL